MADIQDTEIEVENADVNLMDILIMLLEDQTGKKYEYCIVENKENNSR